MAPRGRPRIARISADGDFGAELQRLTRALGAAADAAERGGKSSGAAGSGAGGGPSVGQEIGRAVRDVLVQGVGGAALRALSTPGGGLADVASNVAGNASSIGGTAGAGLGAVLGNVFGGPAGGRAGAKVGEVLGTVGGAVVERETAEERAAREKAIAFTAGVFGPQAAAGKPINKEEMRDVMREVFQVFLNEMKAATAAREVADLRTLGH